MSKEKFSIKLNPTTGQPAVGKDNQGKATFLIQTDSGIQMWLNKELYFDKASKHKTVAYEVLAAGTQWKAPKDSTTTKLQAWLKENVGKTAQECTIPADKQDEPLYFKDEMVTRRSNQYTLTNFEDQREEILTLREKLLMMKELGISVNV